MIVNFFSDFCYPGGLTVHQGEIALVLKEKYNVDVNLCVPWPLRYDVETHKKVIETAKDLEKLYKPLKFLRKISSQKELQQAIAEADINHFHGTFTTEREFLQSAIKLSPKEKNVYTFHSESPNLRQESNNLKIKRNMERMSKIFVVSERVAKAVSEVCGVNDSIITQNAPFRIDDKSNNLKTEILFVGRLNETKGIGNVIEALKSLNLNNTHFTVQGEAEFDPQYKEIIEDIVGKSENIDLISTPLPRSEIMELFRKADIFYFPSRFEGGPLVVLEALSSGCAVVTTPVGMVSSVIENGVNGFICEFNDLEMQKQTIQELINNKELLNKIKFNARATKLPNWEETADVIYRYYLEMIAK